MNSSKTPIKQIIKYVTSDGKEFQIQQQAEKYQAEIDFKILVKTSRLGKSRLHEEDIPELLYGFILEYPEEVKNLIDLNWVMSSPGS